MGHIHNRSAFNGFFEAELCYIQKNLSSMQKTNTVSIAKSYRALITL